MKKKLLFALALSFLFLMPAWISAKAATSNQYHQVDYSSSREDVEKFESILREEGYVCVTKGCTDNEDWTQALLDDEVISKSLGVFLLDGGTDYRLYISPYDYKHCIEERDISTSVLIAEAYIVDYYVFNHANEEGSANGLMDDAAVEAGYTTGWLTIYLNVDDDLRERPNLTYSIILFGKGAQTYYDLSTSDADQNGYVIRHRIPEDSYTVYSAIADAKHMADYTENKNGADFRIQADMNRDLYITFEKIDIDEDLASGSKMTFNPFSDNDSSATIVMPDGTEVTVDTAAADARELEEIKQSRQDAAAIVFAVLVLFLVIVAWIFYKKWKKRENELN